MLVVQELEAHVHGVAASSLDVTVANPQALLSPTLHHPSSVSMTTSTSPLLGLDSLNFEELDKPQGAFVVFSTDLMSEVGFEALDGLGDILMEDGGDVMSPAGGADPLLSCGASKCSSKRSSFSMEEDL